ncbi:hypothetical protein PoMZ_02367 [Pyricularia oryzae]|uniref:GH16 domain-containing protein n=1 Tax=Pyricularia oryzae TaxID=318829 RepID=A0A4P7N4X6_PYROR|nr:hypothetical protein PoMZ_02367 [Pyricularia oryzae]
MSPSLVTLATAVLACASTAAAAKAYQIEETYDTSNVNSKWDFFQSKFDTGNVLDIDPTEGFVNYRSYNDAKSLGVLSEESGSIMMKPNFPAGITANGKGPDSVRLESKARYQQGLFIADFSRFPKPVCGSWPAFWMFGNSWPEEGELDIYEGWNVQPVNGIALHTDHAAKVGSCHLDPQDVNADVHTTNCDNFFTDIPRQWEGTACLVKERNGLWGNPTGGVYAIEWSSQNVSVWSWAHDKTPADVRDGKPSPRTWGRPHFFIGDSKCDIDRVLKNQKMVLNLDFCGVTAGNEGIWGEECKAKTGAATCAQYVAGNPSAFSDVAFGLRSIKVYQNKEVEEPKPTTTAQSTTTTTTTTPSSTSSPSSTNTTTSPSTTATTTASSTEASTEASTSASSTLTTTTPASTSPSATATPSSTSDCEEDEPTGTPTPPTTKASTTAAGTTTTKEPEQSVTSTLTTTKTYTVTSCAPTVTSCSLGQVTSEVITTTTICPVTTTATGTATSTAAGSSTITPIGTLTPTGTATTKEPEQSVTSTLTTTKTYTITSCAPTVTNCPIGQVTSEVFTTTTVCPVTTTDTGSTSTKTLIGTLTTPTGAATTKAPEQSVTSTLTTTKTYTITSCAPAVTNCPIGQVTSEVITTTTVCPPEPTSTLKTTTIHSTLSLTSTIRIPRPSSSSVSSKSTPPFPSSSAFGGSNSTLPGSTKTATPTLTRGTVTGTGSVIKPTTATTPPVPIVTAGASGVEAAGLMAVGALFLFAL